jgi:hypothetical protein
VPSFDFNDPQMRVVDLDGDGISDVIQSGSRLECFFNHPDPGKAWRRTRYMPRGERFWRVAGIVIRHCGRTPWLLSVPGFNFQF